MEHIADIYAALKADASGLSLGVQIWMKSIALSMLLGLVVAFVDRRALWIVLAMGLTILSLFVVKGLWPDIPRGQIGTWAHLVFWPIGLVGLWRGGRRDAVRGWGERIARGWAYWVSGLMTISLVLDAMNAVSTVI